jgi:hypothetical protein
MRYLLIALLITNLYMHRAYAEMPVFDYAVWYQLLEEYNELERMHKLLTETEITNINQLNSIIGNYGLGMEDFLDQGETWGNDIESWEDVIETYERGNVEGALGKAARQMEEQFPIDTALVAEKDPKGAEYYQVHAETALAVRATSQIEFDQIEDNIEYQQAMLQKIDSTPNLKAAVDLLGRLQAESNLIQLRILRMMAINSQQQSIESQGYANAALERIEFYETDF